ncbi:MAG TPA: surface-adhesin E family protein, partial [Pyrinomonadaceae bacterium]
MKTIPSLLLSITILLFACCLVFAQENRWSYVGTDASGTRFFIDRNSIEIKGNRLRVWNKFFYANQTYRLSLFEWACAEKKYLILDETSYSPDGRVIGMDRAPRWLFVTPDSMSETLYKAICSSSK